MVLKWIFDRVVSFIGIVCLCWIFPIVAILIKIKMPGGPVLFCQKRVGKDGKLFTCHKFRSMMVAPKVNSNENEKAFGNENEDENEKPLGKKAVGNENSNGWSTVSVAGDSRITPFGAKLRHYKIDELPELWDVLIGNMSFVGPRPDVPGYADQLQGDDRKVLKLRPGITGPATLKYRLEDEMIAEFVRKVRLKDNENEKACGHENENEGARGNENEKAFGNENENENFVLPENVREMADQELAVWYNDNIIYPDKVRLNKYYYEHYSFVKDIQIIFATVLGFKVDFAGERI